MQEKHLFEYAVVRVVPRVEREEFVNAGVILYCRSLRFLEARCLLPVSRLQTCFPATDLQLLQQYLDAFVRIAAGDHNAGPIARLDPASRFRWLTATRSTILQTSKVHPGRCADAVQQLQHLMHMLVLPEDHNSVLPPQP
jgi:hypothetical protein